jgi:hypothetical protein
MFELTEEQRKQVLQYLWTRPASLKSTKNDSVTPKK